jgi:hypothetical protein
MKPESGIERWVYIHGHKSRIVANLIVRQSNNDELTTYVWALLNLCEESEAIDIVNEVQELDGDSQ